MEGFFFWMWVIGTVVCGAICLYGAIYAWREGDKNIACMFIGAWLYAFLTLGGLNFAMDSFLPSSMGIMP